MTYYVQKLPHKKSYLLPLKVISENYHLKSLKWFLKMVWASSSRSVVLRISLWFLIFDCFVQNDVTKTKSFLALKNCFEEFSYEESKMVLKNCIGVIPKIYCFANKNKSLNLISYEFFSKITSQKSHLTP